MFKKSTTYNKDISLALIGYNTNKSKRVKSRFIILFTIFILSSLFESCTTYGGLGNTEYYIGKSITLLIHRKGQPKAMFDRSDGTVIIIYEHILFDDTRSGKWSTPTGKMVYCDYDLFMSKDFKIYKAETLRTAERKNIEDFKYYGLNE